MIANPILRPSLSFVPLYSTGSGDIINGLVAWYKLNGDATDSSGNGYNGTANNSPTYTNGQNGSANGAMVFNGSNQNVTSYNAIPIYGTNTFSLTCWVYPYVLSSGSDYTAQKQMMNVDGDEAYLIQNYDETWLFGFKDANNSTYWQISSNTNYLTNQWTFLAGTYDGNTLSIYVNGVLQNTASVTSNNAANNQDSTTIGSAGDASRFCDGVIDDARIYNRALISTEISTLYSNGAK